MALLSIPACPLRTGMCYGVTGCDGGKERVPQRLLIWSLGLFPCVCGLHTQSRAEQCGVMQDARQSSAIHV